MKIQKINNIISYKGTFEDNELLQKSLNEADDYELKRFSDNLKRMNAQNDNKNFVLRNRKLQLGDIRTFELALWDNNKDEFIKTVCKDYIYSPKAKETNFRFYNALESINNFLENLYPKQKTTCIKREILLKLITKNLVK